MSDTTLLFDQITDVSAPLALAQLHACPFDMLVAVTQRADIRMRMDANRRNLSLDIARHYIGTGRPVTARGITEITENKTMQLRFPEFSLRPGSDDVTITPESVASLGLRPGLMVECELGISDKDRSLVTARIVAVEGTPAEVWKTPTDFDALTPVYPKRRVFLDGIHYAAVPSRAVDILAPIGLGQRGLIAAAPRTGKTMLLKTLALSITKNAPDIHLMLLLVDERPEEVTDFQRELNCEIYASTFDEQPVRHVQICEAVNERAKRLVELGKDVVILVDSITRVSRGYNNLQPSGRTMSGGVDAKALSRPRKFFGSARNTEEGGSLTILATALIGTESKMDDLIFEEFKGTGNMEIFLDRSIADLRIFPAINISQTATRHEDLLYHPDEYERIVGIRRKLADMPAAEAIEILISNLNCTRSNIELLMTGLRY